MFTPIGRTARWRIVWEELMAGVGEGDIITYAAMGEALDLDPAEDRGILQQVMRRAAQELEDERKHAVEVVPNIGYRVVRPVEHIALAQKHQKKSVKALHRGMSKVENLDMGKLDPETRKLAELTAMGFRAQMDFNKRFEGRARRLEEAVTEVVTGQEQTADEVAELRRRITRLERGLEQP